MNFKITLHQKIDGNLVASKIISIEAENEDVAKQTAIDLAYSSQSGLFRVMREGEHQIFIGEEEGIKFSTTDKISV